MSDEINTSTTEEVTPVVEIKEEVVVAEGEVVTPVTEEEVVSTPEITEEVTA